MTLNSSTTAVRDRRITTRYPIGEVKDGRDVGTRYVEVATSHAKERRTLLTRLTYIDVIEVEPGYTVAKWGSDYPFAVLQSTPTNRYSDKALVAQHTEAVARFEAGDFETVTPMLMLAEIRRTQEVSA